MTRRMSSPSRKTPYVCRLLRMVGGVAAICGTQALLCPNFASAQVRRATLVVNAEEYMEETLRSAVSEALNNEGYILAPESQVEAARLFVVGDGQTQPNQQQAREIWQRVGSDIGIFLEAKDVGDNQVAMSLTVFGAGPQPQSRVAKASGSTMKYEVSSMVSSLNLGQATPSGSGAATAGAGAASQTNEIGVAPPGFIFDIGFLAGFGGEGTIENEDGDELTSGDFDPTLGAELRALFAIGKFFALGPLVRFSRYQPEDDVGTGNILEVAFDVAPVGRFRFHEKGEVYAMLPIGFSLGIFDEDEITGAFGGDSVDVGVGWNVGLKAGARTYLQAVSFFAELGAIWSRVNSSVNAGSNSADFTAINGGQFTLTVGVGFGS